jgi:V/A-type H+-transporting ATPase subunit F
MSYFVIGDEETVIGFRLAGVPGRAARTPYETTEALRVAVATEGIRIIVITEKLAAGIEAELAGYRAMDFPLVITIPDRTGPSGKRETIRDLIKAAVGVKI